jgi:hypothetical protein
MQTHEQVGDREGLFDDDLISSNQFTAQILFLRFVNAHKQLLR